jgi:hypothetical protein
MQKYGEKIHKEWENKLIILGEKGVYLHSFWKVDSMKLKINVCVEITRNDWS